MKLRKCPNISGYQYLYKERKSEARVCNTEKHLIRNFESKKSQNNVALPTLTHDSSKVLIDKSIERAQYLENLNPKEKNISLSNLVSKFKEPSSSSEAVTMKSICNILKTIQPKRKEAIPSTCKYNKTKDKSVRPKEHKPATKIYKKGTSITNAKNGPHKDFYKQTAEAVNQIQYQPPDTCSSKRVTHKRCSSQLNKRTNKTRKKFLGFKNITGNIPSTEEFEINQSNNNHLNHQNTLQEEIDNLKRAKASPLGRTSSVWKLTEKKTQGSLLNQARPSPKHKVLVCESHRL
ncbi:unnamed protein product [Moneuplotes crassus]|uniref:Uncharacterized protein n=1 Tax=Euplotes crassus TaxID=5936 RepID=A0AAD1UL27_EUPCR|nr:unnamed protein product [Moneuplotes crassus]